MSLPNLPAGDKFRREVRTEWGGINLNENAGDGELIEAMNMSSREYPLLATEKMCRRGRVFYYVFAPFYYGPGALTGSTGGIVAVTSGGQTTYKIYDLTVREAVVNITESQLLQVRNVIMQDKLWLFPSKQVYDFSNHTISDMESTFNSDSTSVSFQDGTIGGVAAAGNTIYCSGASWASYFSVGDAVTISGSSHSENNKTPIIREISGDYLRFDENCFTVATENHIKVARKVPDMDFICVNENRMWGCKGDTIYASKLGDPLNWNVYDGLSTDSWSVQTGTTGKFTGCCSFQGYPTFFKEGSVFKVLGDEANNFTLRKISVVGVAPGCDRSIVEIRGRLYYVSINGVCEWNGGDYPDIVSLPLGFDPSMLSQMVGYYGASGGTDGSRYYLHCVYWQDDEHRLLRLFIYDPRFRTWHEQEQFDHPIFFVGDGANWIMLKQSGTTNTDVFEISAPRMKYSGQTEWTPEWRVTFADSTRAYKTALTGSESKKGVLRLLIRCKLAGSMKVWIAYDGGEFEEAAEFSETAKTSKVVPLILRRCDFWQLRLTGTGDAVIYSIAVEKYGGEWQQA